jgi:lipopolysaccharide biosynthesis glycosyltransferase
MADLPSSRRDEIQVAAACDEAYAVPLAAMLASLDRSLGRGRRATVHVLERGLAAATKAAIERSVRRERVGIAWIPIAIERLAWLRRTVRSFDNVSIDSYSRLLIPELLPHDLDRVIYLDCDLVIRRDLGELFDLELAGHYVLAAAELDPGARFVSSPRGLRRYRELGLPPDLETCNSGVLVINLDKWRADLLAQRVFHYLHAVDRLSSHDQDGLNAAMAGAWGRLDPRWNVTMHIFRDDFDRALRARLLRDAFIVHFNTALKPWQFGFGPDLRDLFFEHLDRTPWTGWRPTRPAHPWIANGSRVGIRILRKRWTAISKATQVLHDRLTVLRGLRQPLPRLDQRALRGSPPDEIRLFLVVERAGPDLAGRLARHFANGVDRALVALGRTGREEVEELLRVDPGVHLFAFDPAQRSRELALRHLLQRYGQGHWCLIAEADEELHDAEGRSSLRDLCARLEVEGCGALTCRVLDGASPAVPPGRRIEMLVRDPVKARFFTASLLVPEDCAIEDLRACRSKVPLLRFRPNMLIAEDLRAVHGVRMAPREGTLLRLHAPDGPALFD